jgi:hypothetical protein
MAESWWDTIDLSSTLETEFQEAVNRQDDERAGRGKAAVVRFTHDGVCQPSEIPESPKELHRYLNWHLDKISMNTESSPNCLVILEDLGRNWINVLGPTLQIPISVFALHWEKPEAHIQGDVRVPLGTSPDRHFILNYRQFLPLVISDKSRGLCCHSLPPYIRLDEARHSMLFSVANYFTCFAGLLCGLWLQ